MRGERATLGKSLLDVQRELRIKASYIAAIENCDPSAFDTPGFIAGYVRSYARYLGMDPDEAFAAFCEESGFSVAHGMSQEASTIRKPNADEAPAPRVRNPLADPSLPFAPASDSLISRVEPGAIGSSLVLVALIAGIGYGGWSVLQEVQRVQVSPVEQTPVVLSELDPLDGAIAPSVAQTTGVEDPAAGVFTPPTTEAFDRLYRPQALDVPVLVARDAPISTLDPEEMGGSYGARTRGALPEVQDSSLAVAALAEGLTRQTPNPVTQPVTGQGVNVLAVRSAWVQVTDETGKVFFSGIMDGGDTYAVPRDALSPRIQVGESGAVYFSVDGETLGPAGPRGAVTQNVSLAAADLKSRFDPATPGADDDLMTVLVEMDLKRQTGGATGNVLVAADAPQTQIQPLTQAPTRVQAPAPILHAPLASAPEQLAALAPVTKDRVESRSAPVLRAPETAEAPRVAPTFLAPGRSVDGTQDLAQDLAQGLAQDVARAEPGQPNAPQVLESLPPAITVVATSETWVEVSLPSGKKIFAATMQPGDTYAVPQTDAPPKIFSGNGGGVYFALNEQDFMALTAIVISSGAISSLMRTTSEPRWRRRILAS